MPKNRESAPAGRSASKRAPAWCSVLPRRSIVATHRATWEPRVSVAPTGWDRAPSCGRMPGPPAMPDTVVNEAPWQPKSPPVAGKSQARRPNNSCDSHVVGVARQHGQHVPRSMAHVRGGDVELHQPRVLPVPGGGDPPAAQQPRGKRPPLRPTHRVSTAACPAFLLFLLARRCAPHGGSHWQRWVVAAAAAAAAAATVCVSHGATIMSGRWRWDGLHHEALLWQRVRDRHHAGWERQRVRLQEPLPQRRLPRLESLSIHCEGGGGGGGWNGSRNKHRAAARR
jgi:hypothetical protein